MTKLIFDYDGTLHNCLKIYAPSFRKAYSWLVKKGYAEAKEYSDKEISYWLGFNSTDMWTMFQPQLATEIREKCRRMIGEEMARHLDGGDAELFKGAEEVLSSLKENGFTLIFLSNCRIKYMQRHNSAFRLDRFFDYFYCAEDFDFIPKHEIFRRIKPNHKGDFIVIGDRFHDIETAALNGLKSIGCAYGYGTSEELAQADTIIHDISEIPDAVKQLSRQTAS